VAVTRAGAEIDRNYCKNESKPSGSQAGRIPDEHSPVPLKKRLKSLLDMVFAPAARRSSGALD
jgi:hypothetical protein